jgi:uncharacterized protein YjcR
MGADLLTPADLADKLGVPVRTVMLWRKSHAWPSVTIGRRCWFTPEQVAQIIAKHTETPQPAPSVVVSGQTTRSARHAR